MPQLTKYRETLEILKEYNNWLNDHSVMLVLKRNVTSLSHTQHMEMTKFLNMSIIVPRLDEVFKNFCTLAVVEKSHDELFDIIDTFSNNVLNAKKENHMPGKSNLQNILKQSEQLKILLVNESAKELGSIDAPVINDQSQLLSNASNNNNASQGRRPQEENAVIEQESNSNAATGQSKSTFPFFSGAPRHGTYSATDSLLDDKQNPRNQDKKKADNDNQEGCCPSMCTII